MFSLLSLLFFMLVSLSVYAGSDADGDDDDMRKIEQLTDLIHHEKRNGIPN